MLKLVVAVHWGKTLYSEDILKYTNSVTVVNDFIRGLFKVGVFSPLDCEGIDSGHFIYKLLCKWRQEAKPFPDRVVIEGVREVAPKLTEKEKQVQHALGLLTEYDIVVCCYDPSNYDIM